jgi:RNA polymerase primary sigma factor
MPWPRSRDEMRIDELIDGLIDPNAASEEELAASKSGSARRGREEDDEDEDAGDDGGAAATASLLQLKVDALERFTAIRGLFTKRIARW